ncbi:hypothetical protein NHX12_012676 [Muraenolepis orangiensis]|uniref:Uncharacterized protein n=1 Tax=Muraenolepis orangiensis TaxID=630683 RepID=A0A9Q0DEL9_9TELE|nr:hypothetical protein NHX12_012676 [Muraenolepis orangiensis]
MPVQEHRLTKMVRAPGEPWFSLSPAPCPWCLQGQWCNNLFNGQGSMIHASGVVYDGLWTNGRPLADAQRRLNERTLAGLGGNMPEDREPTPLPASGGSGEGGGEGYENGEWESGGRSDGSSAPGGGATATATPVYLDGPHSTPPTPGQAFLPPPSPPSPLPSSSLPPSPLQVHHHHRCFYLHMLHLHCRCLCVTLTFILHHHHPSGALPLADAQRRKSAALQRPGFPPPHPTPAPGVPPWLSRPWLIGREDSHTLQPTNRRVEQGRAKFEDLTLAPPSPDSILYQLEELEQVECRPHNLSAILLPTIANQPVVSVFPPGEYVIMVEDVTTPPFMGQTLPTAFALLRLLPAEASHPGAKPPR